MPKSRFLNSANVEWLKSFNEKYGDDAVVDVSDMPFVCTKDTTDNATYIEGYASTKDIDRYDEIIEPTAYQSHLKQFMEHPIMLFMHGWRDIPIGLWTEATIDEKGLYVRGKISNTSLGRDIIKLIDDGVLSRLSIGARVLKDEFDHETEIRTITDVELFEISIVNIPANPAAVFQQAKALQLSLGSINDSSHKGNWKKESDVPNVQTDDALKLAKGVEKTIGSWDKDETIASAMETADKRLKDLTGICKEAVEKQKALEKDQITRAEYETFAGKIADDLKSIHDDVLTAKNANEIQKARYPIADWRSHLKGATSRLMTKDNGQPMSEWDQRAFILFNLPIEAGSEQAAYIKSMRDMHDFIKIKDALLRYKQSPVSIYRTEEWQSFKTMVAKLDPEFAEKAMYSTGSALGDEWVPTIMSGEMEELYRLQPTIESWLRPFAMPSNPATWPIKVSWATAYRGGEAVVDNPPEALKSSFGTGVVTFSAELCIAAIPVSPELIEDSLVNMVAELRTAVIQSLADGFERAAINGDTAGTHQDTTYSHATTAMETAFLGFRAKAFDDSKTFDTQSSTATVGDATTAFHVKDVRYNRSLLGVAGIRANELLHICNPHTWVFAMNFDAVLKANERGAPSTLATGAMESLDGSPIYVTSNMAQTQATTGLETGASTYSSWLTINRRIATVGTKRGVLVEFEKDIKTQQLCFVGTTRKDLQYVCASTVYPCALGFKIA